MERRQKQELPETQKKEYSAEQMNLKETISADVRKELSKFEITCHNMALLLQCLGIKVGSKPKLEVVRLFTRNSDFRLSKRALFAFHPDRFSRADVRHQLQAEEKFKLISRMKQKYNM
ncbi:hypothetical protein LIER_22004 [Lithospermum erythrorhizon]|uniref:Uncharacterized protein n=1 Tax=Lithospermum erythrorhizon TaxID=34254 RepID=A0AAV3QSF8_LITER